MGANWGKSRVFQEVKDLLTLTDRQAAPNRLLDILISCPIFSCKIIFTQTQCISQLCLELNGTELDEENRRRNEDEIRWKEMFDVYFQSKVFRWKEMFIFSLKYSGGRRCLFSI